jgi:hypothetical protein
MEAHIQIESMSSRTYRLSCASFDHHTGKIVLLRVRYDSQSIVIMKIFNIIEISVYHLIHRSSDYVTHLI